MHVQHRDYLPALDGLRALAILLVVASHLGLGRVVPGALGVTLFFFISGYLITRQLLSALSARGRTDFAAFYLRRFLRLAPAAIVYVLLGGVAFAAAGGHTNFPGWLAALTYGANYYALYHGYGYTLPGVRHPFDILWSLAIEEQFYVLWPCLLALSWRWKRLPHLLLAVCAAVLLWRATVFGTCFHGEPMFGPPFCAPQRADPLLRYNQLYLGTVSRFDSLAWGALLAVLETRATELRNRRVAGPIVAVLGALALALSLADGAPFARFVWRTSCQGVAFFCLVPWLLWRESAMQRALSASPMLLLGRASYVLYLWHWGGMALADAAVRRFGVPWLAVAMPATLVLTSLAYVLIEKPMLRLRHAAGSAAPAR